MMTKQFMELTAQAALRLPMGHNIAFSVSQTQAQAESI
ncbi:hypothetical protein Slin_4853 [Spirosoma linguale DSM 74]|uniref:Uncharacterized protein n=1 Tax=Spirosoma linguale (strain ATCC 33905 / DSM 74 / LMG 10896 / Claus 1) TaxID=504472 RepID=D2QQQ0_SPILD|nr:hypothetical protein Slin_4853 [Spirosoma linguale DSM 74]